MCRLHVSMTPVQFLYMTGLQISSFCVQQVFLVRLTLVLEDDLLHLVAVGVFVDAVAPNISLPYVRIVVLDW